MRVVQIGPYPPPHGGVSRNLVAIRSFLLQRSIPCAVVNITRHRGAQADEVYHPSGPLGVLRLLFRLKADIIHIHFGGGLSPRLLALYFACSLLPGRKTVLTFHSGGYPSTPEGRATGPGSFAGRTLRRLDRLIAVNAEIARFFQQLGVPADRIRVIAPHAVAADDAAGETIPPAIEAFARAHDPLLITVGGLEPEYDVALQVRVLDQVRKVHANAGLCIIGSGTLESDLRQQIAAAPYRDAVMLCGDVPHGATMQLIARARLMLRTTHYDGDSISVREALHLGTSVVASDNGMRPAGVTVVPARDLQALERAVMTVLARPIARDAVPKTGDVRNLEAVLDVYRELVHG